MTHAPSGWRKTVSWILVAVSAICFLIVLGCIVGTIEQLSEPYNHEGQLDRIKRTGIFWSVFFGIAGTVLVVSALRLSKKVR